MEKLRTVYLSLGSNIGDRAANIARAVEALAAAGLRITQQSLLYATEAVSIRTQAWFLNCCVEAETDLMPRRLLHVTQGIERELGGRHLVRRGPRTIDIDLLLYGTTRMRTRELELPHPRLAERRFVLIPLREIAPALRHPALRKTIAELLADCPDRSRVTHWFDRG